MEQKRLLLALILSTVILFGWSYLFSPQPPQNNNTNAPQTAEVTPQTSEAAQPTANQSGVAPSPSSESAKPSEESVPQKSLTVKTPLYEVEFDSRGGVVKSWIIKQNKDTGRPLCSIASAKGECQPLQLVSPEGSNRGQFPLRLEIGKSNSLDDANAQSVAQWNQFLKDRNYKVAGEGFQINDADSQIEVNAGESSKQINLVLEEPSTGLRVVKSLVFDPSSYIVPVAVSVTRNGQVVPNVKMSVGPSVGDQGVPQYTFYSVAPQGVAVAKDESVRLYASEVHEEKSAQDQAKGYKAVEGPVEWAAVGDTYFAMALVLPKPADRLEFTTEEYQHDLNGEKEQRFLITGYVPIPSDSSNMYLYVGPKDHFALDETSRNLSQTLGGREVDLEQLIDYGWLGFTRPIAVQLLKAIKYINNLVGNYGVAIIIFTIIIYMLFFPLKWRSTKSMKKAQKHAPRMKELQQKIKGMKPNDPRLKELQMEQLRLMKEANPLGGCLPLLIQMPFLIALYSAITISIDFRQASFLWMPDLSAADPWRLLPILMAGSMVILQLSTPAPSADPLQRKMMAVILPVMMLWMLWSAPSGLLVYWLVGNLVGFGQQIVINRMVKSEDDEEPPQESAAPTKKNKKQKLNATRVSQA